MYIIRKTNSKRELEKYVRDYSEISGYVLDMDYLLGANVYGVFNRGRMVGGFVVNTKSPLRYVTYIPEEHRQHQFLISEISSFFSL